MKIYINHRFLPSKHHDIVKTTFPNIEITSKEEDSYDSEAVFVGPDFIKEEILEKYPSLKWIQLLTAGYDRADLNALRKRNIILSNARGVYSITIAEDVLAKILMINRNIRQYLKQMEEGIWQPNWKETEIDGSIVGILGTGSIGEEIAKRIKAFNTKIIGYNQSGRIVENFDEIVSDENGLNYLLKNSDYIIIALPLSNQTRFLINLDKLKLMKKDAVIVNIGRGEIINLDDLVWALKNNVIKAAALDVVYPEPLPKDYELWKLENVFITPHNAVSSPKINKRLVALIIENLKNYLNNKNLKNIIY
jgi:phosphoglycerate dehydrogenase-like enzyme